MSDERAHHWTFLSNHGHVLLAVAEDPEARIRDVADRVGITERAAQLIIGDLVEAGYVVRTRVGRRNSYRLAPAQPFRHPAESGRNVDDLVAIFRPAPEPDPTGPSDPTGPTGTTDTTDPDAR